MTNINYRPLLLLVYQKFEFAHSVKAHKEDLFKGKDYTEIQY